MSDYRILTDSTTDLSPELIREMDVDVIPLYFTVDGQTYQNDPAGKDMSFSAFYDKLRAGSQSSTTQITPERFREIVEPLLQQGTDVLYLAFSSGLSGTYNASRLMFEELAEQYPQRKVVTVDTLAASMGEGLLVYLAAQQKKQGKSLEEVAQWVTDNRLKLSHWFTVDDLNHLKRGGRVSGAAAFFGTMLNIKPVLHVDDEGHLIPMEKVRGRRQSLDALVDHMAKTGIDNCYYIKFAAKPGAEKSTLPRRLEPDTSESDLPVKVEPVEVAEVEVAEPTDSDTVEPAAFESDAPVFAQPESEPSAIM